MCHPIAFHEEPGCAVIDIAMYLKTSCTLSLKFKLNLTKGFEYFVDTGFASLWNNIEAPMDLSTAKSRVR